MVTTAETVLGAAALLAALAGLAPVAALRGAGDAAERRLLALGGGAALVLAAGLAVGVAGIGAIGADGGGTVYAGQAAGWWLATALGLAALGGAAGVGSGLIGAAVLLDALAVGLGAAAAADLALAGMSAETTSYALAGGSAVAVLALLVVLLRPFSGAASGLSSDGAAAFSVLRNVLVGGFLLATVLTAVGVGVLAALGTAGTVTGLAVVQVLTVGGVALSLRGTAADLAAGEGAAWTGGD